MFCRHDERAGSSLSARRFQMEHPGRVQVVGQPMHHPLMPYVIFVDQCHDHATARRNTNFVLAHSVGHARFVRIPPANPDGDFMLSANRFAAARQHIGIFVHDNAGWRNCHVVLLMILELRRSFERYKKQQCNDCATHQEIRRRLSPDAPNAISIPAAIARHAIRNIRRQSFPASENRPGA